MAAPTPELARAPRRTLVLERRLSTSPRLALAIRVGSVIAALLVSGLLLELAGKDALKVFSTMFIGAFGSKFGFSETLVRTVPILLCGLGVALASRMQLWNIGAEGQLHLGAVAAAGVVMLFPDLPAPLMLPLMALAGAVAGGLWALGPALARAYAGASEIITTLLLNYVAIDFLHYLVYGPWKDPKGFNFPFTPPFPQSAIIPPMWARVHWGLPVALLLAALMYFVVQRTRWGYEIRVVGENPTVARFAGIPIVKNILAVMFVSGMLAGLSGMMEVSGLIGRLQRDISPGYGYTAIIVAYLARLNPASLVLAAFLFGGLQAGGYSVQSLGIPVATALMIQGGILFFVLAGEMLTTYRIRLTARGEG